MLRRLLPIKRRALRWLRCPSAADHTVPRRYTCAEQVLTQQLTKLSPNTHPQLSPVALWQYISAKLTTASSAAEGCDRVTLGSLFDDAIWEGCMPEGTDLDTFSASIAALSPVMLAVSQPATDLADAQALRPWETSRTAWVRSLLVSRQPWVPAAPMTTASAVEGHKVSTGVIAAVFHVIPTFFVSMKWVQTVMEQGQYRGPQLSQLRWSDLQPATQPLRPPSPFLEWTSDKRAVRLAGWIQSDQCPLVTGERQHHSVGAADVHYRLLPMRPTEYHAALALLARVIPSFFVPVGGGAMVSLFKQQHAAHAGTSLYDHFPSIECLLCHPDLRPALEFAEQGRPATTRTVPRSTSCDEGSEDTRAVDVSTPALLVRLRDDFGHSFRGSADPFYRAAAVAPSAHCTMSPSSTPAAVTQVPFTNRMQVLADVAAAAVAGRGDARDKGGFAPALAAVDIRAIRTCAEVTTLLISVAMDACPARVSSASSSSRSCSSPVPSPNATTPIQVLTFSVESSSRQASATLPEPLASLLRCPDVAKVLAPSGTTLEGSLAVLLSGDTHPSRGAAAASAGSLAALCEYLGVPVGDAMLALPNLHTYLCAELGVSAAWPSPQTETLTEPDLAAEPDAKHANVVETLLAARELICRYRGDRSLPSWNAFLTLSADQRTNHAYSTRLLRYLSARPNLQLDYKSSGDADLPTSLPLLVWSSQLAEKQAMLKELVFKYGPERLPLPSRSAATPASLSVSPGSAAKTDSGGTAVTTADDTASLLLDEPLSNGNRPAKEESENPSCEAMDEVRYDSIEALLEEAGRLSLHSSASPGDAPTVDELRTVRSAGSSDGPVTERCAAEGRKPDTREAGAGALAPLSSPPRVTASTEQPNTRVQEDDDDALLSHLVGDNGAPSDTDAAVVALRASPQALTSFLSSSRQSRPAARGSAAREGAPSATLNTRPRHTDSHDDGCFSELPPAFAVGGHLPRATSPRPSHTAGLGDRDTGDHGVSREEWLRSEPERCDQEPVCDTGRHTPPLPSTAAPEYGVASEAFWDSPPRCTDGPRRRRTSNSAERRCCRVANTSPFSLTLSGVSSDADRGRAAAVAVQTQPPLPPAEPSPRSFPHRAAQKWPREVSSFRRQQPRRLPSGSHPHHSSRTDNGTSDRTHMRQLIQDIVRATPTGTSRHVEGTAVTPLKARPMPRAQGDAAAHSSLSASTVGPTDELRALLNTETGRELILKLLAPQSVDRAVDRPCPLPHLPPTHT